MNVRFKKTNQATFIDAILLCPLVKLYYEAFSGSKEIYDTVCVLREITAS